MGSGKKKLLSRFATLACLALAMLVALPAFPPVITLANAQEAGQRESGGGILRFLFQRREPQRQDRVTPPAQQQRRESSAPARRAQPAAPREPAPELVEKAEDASRVLVVGDFMAGGLAEGLVTAYAEEARVLVVERANGSSGLVRNDHYDWPGNIGSVIDEEKPTAVVVMIGSNDRQQMVVNGTRESPRTEAWTAEYERRVAALTKIVRDRQLPLIWVGNLPFRPGAMSSDMIAFNDIYRRIVTEAGGEYVDVWDGFVDETGAFAANGPDMNGQPAQLRAGDGINVTRQGRRKMAFYVERPLARLLQLDGQAPGTLDPTLPGDVIGPIPPGQEPAVVDRTPPMALDDIGSGAAGSALLGAIVQPANGEARTPAEKLARDGIAPDAQPGRADDFSIRRPANIGRETTTAVTP